MNEIDEPFIVEHIDRLNHMHLHDAIWKKDHMPLGRGDIDIDKKLEIANQCKCRIVLETKTIEGLREIVSKLHCYLLK